MASAIVNLAMLYARLAENGNAAADANERVASSAGRLPKDQTGRLPQDRNDSGIVTDEYVPPEVAVFRGFGASGRTSFEEWSGVIEEQTTEMRDFLAELRGGADVGDLVANQSELKEQIDRAGFGDYIDKWAELFVEKLTKGSRIDPFRLDVINRSLPVAEKIIKQWAGKPGKAFSFEQLEADLKEMIAAAQKSITKSADKIATAAKTPAKSDACGKQSSLSVLRHSGALR